jgi:hypothetical protein
MLLTVQSSGVNYVMPLTPFVLTFCGTNYLLTTPFAQQLAHSRIKAKYCQEQMDQLGQCVPSIKAVYQCYEDLGYDKDKILQKFKDHNWVQSLQTQTANITYNSVGQELSDQDSRRQSWTNEDPDWHSMANDLDASLSPAPKTFAAVGNTASTAAAPVSQAPMTGCHEGGIV